MSQLMCVLCIIERLTTWARHANRTSLDTLGVSHVKNNTHSAVSYALQLYVLQFSVSTLVCFIPGSITIQVVQRCTKVSARLLARPPRPQVHIHLVRSQARSSHQCRCQDFQRVALACGNPWFHLFRLFQKTPKPLPRPSPPLPLL